jgi:flagellar motor switch protein FliG
MGRHFTGGRPAQQGGTEPDIQASVQTGSISPHWSKALPGNSSRKRPHPNRSRANPRTRGPVLQGTGCLSGETTISKPCRSIPPDALIQLIQNEHPQTIALIIAHLQPHIASETMALLPDELKPDVAYRIANLDKVASGMLEEIDRVFEEILSNKETSTSQKAGGVPRLAEILNMIDGTSAEQIIEEIEENDPDLAEEIRQNMFVFDDIVLVDDRGLQKVLRSVESQELAVALKASTDDR